MFKSMSDNGLSLFITYIHTSIFWIWMYVWIIISGKYGTELMVVCVKKCNYHLEQIRSNQYNKPFHVEHKKTHHCLSKAFTVVSLARKLTKLTISARMEGKRKYEAISAVHSWMEGQPVHKQPGQRHRRGWHVSSESNASSPWRRHMESRSLLPSLAM